MLPAFISITWSPALPSLANIDSLTFWLQFSSCFALALLPFVIRWYLWKKPLQETACLASRPNIGADKEMKSSVCLVWTYLWKRWSYSVERLVFITLHAASLLRGACSACRAALHPHLQTVVPEVVGIVVILSQIFLFQSFFYAFSKGRSWDFQAAFPFSFLLAQGWFLRAVVLRQHPCGCWLHTLPWHSNPISQFQDQTCKFPTNFCCFTAFPHIRPQLYPPSYLAPT